MWSEKRDLEGDMIFAIFPIVLNIGINFLYYIKGASYESIEAVNNINSSSIFIIFICCLLNFFGKRKKLSKEEKKKLIHGGLSKKVIKTRMANA